MTRAVGVGGGVVVGVAGRALDSVLRQPLWLAAIAASAGAGLIHLVHGPAHLAELGALGVGFYLAAALQLGWAALAFTALAGSRSDRSRGTAVLATSGIAINAAILAAWVTSRVVGLPAGATPWTPEPIGMVDGITAILQGVLVFGLIAALRGWTLPRLPRVQALATSGAAIAIMLIATGTAVAISPSEVGHGHPPGSTQAESGELARSGEHAAPEQHVDTEEHAATDGPSPTDGPAATGDHGEDDHGGEPDPHNGDDEHGTDEHAEDGGH